MLVAFALNANAATVQGWNTNEVVTDSAPYIESESYYSTFMIQTAQWRILVASREKNATPKHLDSAL